jgi:radical SAM/Cys-rich protein
MMETPPPDLQVQDGTPVERNFRAVLKRHGLSLTPVSIETLQVNVTSLCNQACRHCRVDASPDRTEQMDQRTVDRCLEILAKHDMIGTVDITGGAPELNPHFDFFVAQARELNKKVIVRHNLSVTFDGNPQTGEDKRYLPRFFAELQVEVIASLPHYEQEVLEEQRGPGVFNKSIRGMRLLNAEGYGRPGTGLTLNLVHNPVGDSLPGGQAEVESLFRRKLRSRYGLEFNNLYTMTNVPVKRFKDQLLFAGSYDRYMARLVDAFNPEVASGVMCRTLINVGFDGRLYDCDINQFAGMQIRRHGPMTIFNFDYDLLMSRDIQFGRHCFACTAGAGST